MDPIAIPRLDAGAIVPALDALAGRIASDDGRLAAVIEMRGVTFDVTFDVGDARAGPAPLDEWAFFDRLDAARLSPDDAARVAEAARRLVRAWVEAVGRMRAPLCGQAGRGRMTGALSYLARHAEDPEAELRDYCLRRDGEHESRSLDVLRALLDRRGFAGTPEWRLAALEPMLWRRDGKGVAQDGREVSAWRAFGTLAAARDRLTPDAFAGHLRAAVERMRATPDDFAAFGTHAGAVEGALADLRRELGDGAWDDTLRRALETV